MVKRKEEVLPSTYDQDYWIWARAPHGRRIPEDPRQKSIEDQTAKGRQVKVGQMARIR